VSEPDASPEPSVDATRVIAHLSRRVGQLTTDLAIRDILIEDLRSNPTPAPPDLDPPEAPPPFP
jgi:hypothetical protein